ncbi:unnamed protein product [Cyprideis torosa]|uniref:Uncharacterized protein n=1 Tax=Cyprideis torosa TaxID=163714 RepID=A0A7R8WDI7_9CRUS|nr:unnamed protein product [Cyprideis torosa]CAG0894792.1 unnamed protein product [Cyprideis torosa]
MVGSRRVLSLSLLFIGAVHAEYFPAYRHNPQYRMEDYIEHEAAYYHPGHFVEHDYEAMTDPLHPDGEHLREKMREQSNFEYIFHDDGVKSADSVDTEGHLAEGLRGRNPHLLDYLYPVGYQDAVGSDHLFNGDFMESHHGPHRVEDVRNHPIGLRQFRHRGAEWEELKGHPGSSERERSHLGASEWDKSNVYHGGDRRQESGQFHDELRGLRLYDLERFPSLEHRADEQHNGSLGEKENGHHSKQYSESGEKTHHHSKSSQRLHHSESKHGSHRFEPHRKHHSDRHHSESDEKRDHSELGRRHHSESHSGSDSALSLPKPVIVNVTRQGHAVLSPFIQNETGGVTLPEGLNETFDTSRIPKKSSSGHEKAKRKHARSLMKASWLLVILPTIAIALTLILGLACYMSRLRRRPVQLHDESINVEMVTPMRQRSEANPHQTLHLSFNSPHTSPDKDVQLASYAVTDQLPLSKTGKYNEAVNAGYGLQFAAGKEVKEDRQWATEKERSQGGNRTPDLLAGKEVFRVGVGPLEEPEAVTDCTIQTLEAFVPVDFSFSSDEGLGKWEIPATSDLIESFDVEQALAGTFSIPLLKLANKIVQQATKIRIKMDPRGFVDLQAMIALDSGIASYIEFFVSYVR